MSKAGKIYVNERLEHLEEASTGSLKDVINLLQITLEKYTSEGYRNLSVEFDYDEDYYGESRTLILFGERLETDKEYAKRLKQIELEKKKKENLKLNKITDLEKLAKKLGLKVVKDE